MRVRGYRGVLIDRDEARIAPSKTCKIIYAMQDTATDKEAADVPSEGLGVLERQSQA
jgi:hypothetical protein